MAFKTDDKKSIALLHDMKDLLGFEWDGPKEWSFQVLRRTPDACRSYISPNRREFYKILYITKGISVLSIGLKSYYVDKPTIFFIPPHEILTFKKLDWESDGYICFFKRKLADNNNSLKIILDKYGLFTDPVKSAMSLSVEDVAELDRIFEKMLAINVQHGGPAEEDMLQIYLQLLMVTVSKNTSHPEPDTITDEFRHVNEFFQLLEDEVSGINYTSPIQAKTAQEFADKLLIHPNHLNALLKKHTGKNVSTHIKSKLLEESKVLLAQTDWSVQQIGYAVGFADQPNFSQFFKKNAGITPAEFRKNYERLSA
ncbi:AraC family transcriptional regulator [Mucilaginibacter sp. E4BP6]|uniref:AraC family transcriptional regulator n=1 Tax=Mucilaginibacter sp. E4BP6 TaxID=2723089 RepID=UPI0015CBA4BC|nr:AraC family transcriptional regulator [Mucilaginibacter sp. E4BP6]NYE68170.1 AraC-like DNA-binding protein [Mucilaginibacter sp. E4BP6]